MKFLGTVIADTFAAGSKSERQAIFLQTQNGRLLLRREGGNAMHDQSLQQWIGASVEVDGEVHQNVLIAREIRKLL